MKLIICTIACFLLAAKVSDVHAQGQCRPQAQSRVQCGDKGSNRNRALCLSKACCYDPSQREPKCYARTATSSRDFAAKLREAQRMIRPPSRPTNTRPLTETARRLNITVPQEKSRILQSARNFNLGMLGSLMYPSCPLNVPACHRIACQPGNARSEQNPQECYRDPRCCFDQQLFMYKYVFGVNYLGGTPVCYLGPTSLRYSMVAQMIQPWNPFFQEPVVNIFERVFNLNQDLWSLGVCWEATVTNVQFFKTPKCGWIGINKLECHLKGCCYSDATSDCVYPRRLHGGIGNSFGNLGGMMGLSQLFGGSTSLLGTSSGSTTSSNPYNFNLFGLSALTGGNLFGTGGSPFGTGGFFGGGGGAFGTGGAFGLGTGFGGNNLQGMTQDQQDRRQYPELYALTSNQCDRSFNSNPLTMFRRMPCWNEQPGAGGLTTDSYTKLITSCPRSCCQNPYALVPGFGDLSLLGSVSGGGGFNPGMAMLIPGLQQPSTSALASFYCPYFFVPVPGFGDLTNIVKDCCYQHACYHKSIQPRSTSTGGGWPTTGGNGWGTTGGNNNQYSAWGAWSSMSRCNAACNQPGTATRQRSCLQNNRPVSNYNCPGQPSEAITCYGECGGVVTSQGGQWTQWMNVGACQYNTYRQLRQNRQRQCQNQYGQQVQVCSGGSGQDSIPCQSTQQGSAQWSQWAYIGQCQQDTYGRRHQHRQRTCQDWQGQPASGCPGSNRDQISCGHIQRTVQWSQWANVGSCQVDQYSVQKQTRERRCLDASGRDSYGCPGDSRQQVNCQSQRAAQWTQWQTVGSCTSQYGTGTQRRQRSCVDDLGAVRNTCPGPSSGSIACQGQQRYCSWTAWGSYGRCSVTCGSGTRVKSRRCVGANNAACDGRCSGQTTLSLTCTEAACAGTGVTAQWGQWGQYDRSCEFGGSQQTRRRRCFFQRSPVSDEFCVDQGELASTQTTACVRSGSSSSSSQQQYAWANWSGWTTCSRSCGTGVRRRVRTCYNNVGQRRQVSNSMCVGLGQQSTSCYLRRC